MCVGREGEHVSTIPYDGQSSTFEKHNSDSIMHVGVTMAALHSRCGRYIFFVLWLLMAALCNRGAIIFLPCSFFLLSFFLSFFFLA